MSCNCQMSFTATTTTNIAPAWDLLTHPLPLDYVCTILTQHDPIEYFFSIIRLRGGLNNNLTAFQVKYILRKLLFIKSGVVTASFLSKFSLVTSQILENLNYHVEKNSIDEEIKIDMEISVMRKSKTVQILMMDLQTNVLPSLLGILL
jgi:hypothetical protein